MSIDPSFLDQVQQQATSVQDGSTTGQKYVQRFAYAILVLVKDHREANLRIESLSAQVNSLKTEVASRKAELDRIRSNLNPGGGPGNHEDQSLFKRIFGSDIKL
jgi:hypothetical protein